MNHITRIKIAREVPGTSDVQSSVCCVISNPSEYIGHINHHESHLSPDEFGGIVSRLLAEGLLTDIEILDRA